jgi:DNA-binding NarL/FixJ family response regulator
MNEAANPDHALARLKQSPSDFAAGFRYASKDGTTLTEELKDLDPKVSVAVVSAKPQAEVVSRARFAGATFLLRPLNEKTLGEFKMASLPTQVRG